MVISNPLVRHATRTVCDLIPSGVENIYLVGSMAFDESVVPHNGSCTNLAIATDIDIIVDVTPITFVKLYFYSTRNNFVEILNRTLELRGFRTHVSVTTTSLALSRYLSFIRPNTIYMHESTPLLTQKKKSADFSAYLSSFPSKPDALDLVFSAIADYLFTKYESQRSVNEEEKYYVFAKRSSTILYSLLIFKGLYVRSYVDRIKTAKQYLDKLDGVLTIEDLEILRILTEYKISGDSRKLRETLQTVTPTSDYLAFLDNYFKKLASETLAYELNENGDGDYSSRIGPHENLETLLRKYASRKKASISETFMHTFFGTMNSIRQRKRDKLRFTLYSLLSNRLRPADMLRLAVGLTFVKMLNEGDEEIGAFSASIKPLWDLFME